MCGPPGLNALCAQEHLCLILNELGGAVYSVVNLSQKNQKAVVQPFTKLRYVRPTQTQSCVHVAWGLKLSSLCPETDFFSYLYLQTRQMLVSGREEEEQILSAVESM